MRDEVEVDDLGLAAAPGLAACRSDRLSPRDDIADVRRARLELGEVDAEPLGERGVEVDDAAVRLEREEAGRRVVEIVDRVLQLLEDVLLVLALAGDVGDQPADMAVRAADGIDPDAVPARAGRLAADAARHADFLGGAASLLGRDRQPVDRLRRVRVGGEKPLDRMEVALALRARELQERRVRPDRPSSAVGDQDAFGHVLHERVRLPAGRPMHDRAAIDRDQARGSREEGDHADRREKSQAPQNNEAGGILRQEEVRARGHKERKRNDGDENESRRARPARKLLRSRSHVLHPHRPISA